MPKCSRGLWHSSRASEPLSFLHHCSSMTGRVNGRERALAVLEEPRNPPELLAPTVCPASRGTSAFLASISLLAGSKCLFFFKARVLQTNCEQLLRCRNNCVTTGSFFWEGSQRSLALASQQRQRELCGAFHPVHLFLPHEALWMRCSQV